MDYIKIPRVIARRFALLFAFFVSAMVLAGSAIAQSPGSKTPLIAADTSTIDPVELESWLDGYLPYALARGDIAGAVVTVVAENKLILTKGYGYGDVASRTAIDPVKTLVRPGSISKLITWTAVMQLVDQGKINLDADIQTYLDFEVAHIGRAITMRDLMTHRGGFSEVLKYIINDKDHIKSLRQYVMDQMPAPLAEPGTIAAYSNYGSALAGYIVQRVSGLPLEDYVEEQIFTPLGMKKSSFRQPLPSDLADDLASSYALASDGVAKDFEFVGPWPAGSLSATAEDMGRFMLAHLSADGRLMSADAYKTMHASQTSLYPGLSTMALGFVEQYQGDARAIGHGGDTTYFHSDLQLYPERGIGIFVSLNSAGLADATHQIRMALMSDFGARYVSQIRDLPPVLNTAVEHGQKLVGVYESSRIGRQGFTNLVFLLGQTQISMNENGELVTAVLPDIAGQPIVWREVEPYIWQNVKGAERLAAHIEDGRVISVGIEPFASVFEFTPVPVYRSFAFMAPMLALALLVLFGTITLWPVKALVRRYYKQPLRLAGQHRWARLAMLGGCLLTAVLLVVWGVFLTTVMGDLSALNDDIDGSLRLLQWAAIIPIFAILAAIWHAVCVWTRPNHWWTKTTSLFVLFALGIVIWFMVVGGLFNLSLNF